MTEPSTDTEPKRHRTFSCASPEPVPWNLLAALFVELIGPAHDDLGGYPSRIGTASASWLDVAGDKHQVITLADLRRAIDDGSAQAIEFYVHRQDLSCLLFYAITHDPPAVRGDITGPRSLVDQLGPFIDAAFPLPWPYPVLFISWSGTLSRVVAHTLAPMLRRRLPNVDVFFSPDSIAPGDNPTHRMLHDALRRTDAQVAVLTSKSANRPWLVWETAAAWAREAAVIPLFVNTTTADVGGPLTIEAEGVRINDRAALDWALRKLAKRFSMSDPEPFTDDEFAALVAAAESPEPRCRRRGWRTWLRLRRGSG